MFLNASEPCFPYMEKVGTMVFASVRFQSGEKTTPETSKRGHFIWRIDYPDDGRAKKPNRRGRKPRD